MFSILNDYWGLKPAGMNIIPNIQAIINNADEFIVVGGYNFTLPDAKRVPSILTNIIAKSSAGTPSLIICPHKYGKWEINTIKLLQDLVNNNVAVIINSKNHSKFIVAKNDIYFGSANFSSGGLKMNDEVISILDLRDRHVGKLNLRRDLLFFAQNEIHRYNSLVLSPLPINNAILLSIIESVISKVLRYNPNIEKVEKTIANATEVFDLLYEFINISYATFSLEKYVEQQSNILERCLQLEKVIELAEQIINSNEKNLNIDQLLFAYNTEVDSFHDNLMALKSELDTAPDENMHNNESFDFRKKNLEILQRITKTISNYDIEDNPF